MITILLTTVISDVIAGIISSAFVTVAFFILRISMKPRIEVSPFLVRRDRKNEDTGEINRVFQIKFFVKSKYSLENVSIDLYLMNDWYSGNNQNSSLKSFTTEEIELKINNIKYLPGQKDKKIEYNDNCIVVTLVEDLDKIWTDQRDWLELHITSYHTLSGFRSVVRRDYKGFNCIKNGKFKDGEVFEVEG